MSRGRVLAILVVGMAFIALTAGTSNAASSGTWMATGSVTKIDGSTIYMLGKDSNIYKISAAGALVMINGCGTDCYEMTVGDKVRVYGIKCAPREIIAKRVRVFRSSAQAGAGPAEKVVKIVVEKEAPPPETAQPTAPAVQPPACVPDTSCAQQPVTPPQPCDWEGKGVITDINYPGRQIKVQTSSGNYTIDIARARLTNGDIKTSFGALNIGDTVRITGSLSIPGEVQAAQVKVLRTQYEAQNALPLQPVSMAGVIQQVDSASRTFKMEGQSYNIVVSVDDNTVIQEQYTRVGFGSLRPGMRVKMSGYGSWGSGFAAQHIQVISTAP